MLPNWNTACATSKTNIHLTYFAGKIALAMATGKNGATANVSAMHTAWKTRSSGYWPLVATTNQSMAAMQNNASKTQMNTRRDLRLTVRLFSTTDTLATRNTSVRTVSPESPFIALPSSTMSLCPFR